MDGLGAWFYGCKTAPPGAGLTGGAGRASAIPEIFLCFVTH